jgi:hypothetical protein
MTRSNGLANGLAEGSGRRRWAGVAAVALVVSLAACGGKDFNSAVRAPVKPVGASPKVLLDSVRTTTDAKSARLSMRASFSGAGPVGAFAMTLDGVSDFTNGDSEMNMQFEGSIAKFLPDGFEMRVVDHAGYMKLPASIAGGSPNGAIWTKVPFAGPGAGGSTIPGLGQSDPSKVLAYLETVSDDVHAVGADTIRGVETTHYKATLDVGKAVDRAHAPAALREQLRQILQSEDGAAATIPANVWIDGDGLLRRMEIEIDLGAFARAGGASGAPDPGTMDVSLDLYEFGVPVNVEAPPASEISPLGSFGGGPTSPVS